MKNPDRLAFFIASLAKRLNEGQMQELLHDSREAIGYGPHMSSAPKLSTVQDELCDWLAQDAFSEAADERLRAERDEAKRERDEAREKIYESIRGYEAVKREVVRIREYGGSATAALAKLNALLENVPEPENRW